MSYWTVDGIIFDDQDDRKDYQLSNPTHGPVTRFDTLSQAESSLSGGMLTGDTKTTDKKQTTLCLLAAHRSLMKLL